MGIFKFIERKKIIANGRTVKGTVIATKILYWLTVNKRAIRMNNADSSHPHSSHPHMVYFKYSVGGIEYTGKSYLSWTGPVFYTNEHIVVYINKNNPQKYTLNY